MQKKSFFKWINRFLLAISAIIVIVILAFVLLYWQSDVVEDYAREYINNQLEDRGTLQYGSISGSLIRSLEIEEFSFELENQLDLKVDHIEIQYRLWPLLFNRIEISRIFIDRLKLNTFSGDEQKKTPRRTKTNPDSILKEIQNTHFIDSLLRALPRVNLRAAEIFADSIILPAAGVSMVDLETRLSATIKKKSYRLHVKKLKSRVTLQPNNAITVEQIGFLLEGNRHHFTLSRGIFRTKRSQFSLSAYYQLQDSINMDLNIPDVYLDFADFAALTNQPQLGDGYASGSLQVSGQPVHFIAKMEVEGRYRKHRLEHFTLRTEYDRGKIRVHALDVASNDGDLHLSGFGSREGPAYADARFRSIDLSAFSESLPLSDLNGRFRFNFADLRFKRASGSGNLLMSNTMVDSMVLDSLQFELKADNGDWDIGPNSFLKIADSAVFYFEGKLKRNEQLELAVSTFGNHLNNLSERLRLPEMEGRADAQLRVSGNFNDIDVSGNIYIPAFHYDDIRLDSLSFKLYTRNIFSPSRRRGGARFNIARGNLDRMPVRQIGFQASLDRFLIDVSDIRLKSNNNYLRGHIRASFEPGNQWIQLPHFRVQYQEYWLENDDAIAISVDTSLVRIDAFRLKGPQESVIEVAGFWNLQAQDLQTYVYLRNVQLKPFEQFWEKRFTMSGAVNGNVELYTPLTDPEIAMDLNIAQLQYNGVMFGDIVSQYHYRNGELSVENFSLLHQDKINVRLAGDIKAPLQDSVFPDMPWLRSAKTDLRIELEALATEHIAPLLKLSYPLKGTVRGRLNMEGPLSEPIINHRLQTNRLQYDKLRLDTVRVFAQYNDGYVSLDSVSAIVNHTPISLNGWYKYDVDAMHPDTVFADNPFRFHVYSKGRRIDFIKHLDVEVESIDGPYLVDIYIAGTPQHPAITNGRFSLQNGQVLLSLIKDPLKKVNMDVTIRDSVMYFNRFTAVSKKKKDFLERAFDFLIGLIPWKPGNKDDGSAEVNGSVNLSNLVRPELHLDVNMNNLYADYFVENTQVVLQASPLKIRGQDTIRVEGDVTVSEGQFMVDLAQMEKNLYLSEPVVKPSPPYTALNLNIRIPGNFVITSSPLDLTNNFKMNIMGNVQVVMEAGSEEPGITGHLEVVSGKFTSFNQNFTVKSGTIDLNDPTLLNPEINLTAVKVVDEREFELTVSGNLENLNQDIRVMRDGEVIEMSYLDKISLLTLGADVGQITSNADSALRNVGEEVATTSLLTAVERGAEQYTGLDKIEIKSDQSLLNLKKMRLNNGLSDASIKFGKYLTNDLYVEYRTRFGEEVPAPSLGWDAGNRIGLEYRINQSWKLDSFYEKTLLGNNKVKIGINWEFTF